MTDLELAKRYISKAKNAYDRKIPFEMSLKHFKKLMLRKTCTYTGVKLTEIKLGVPPSGNCRSIDRIDASKGYTDENTVVCTYEFNNVKSNLTIKQIEQLNTYLKKRNII